MQVHRIIVCVNVITCITRGMRVESSDDASSIKLEECSYMISVNQDQHSKARPKVA